VIDYSTTCEPVRYFQEFDECYYRVDGDGNVDIVARHRGDPTAQLSDGVVQVVHLQTIYRSVPGVTPVEPTMTNATVSYIILNDGDGVSFDGAGFVFATSPGDGGELTATLESSNLRAMRQRGVGPRVFHQPRVSGWIHARLDPRRTVRILNESRHLLGPLTDAR